MDSEKFKHMRSVLERDTDMMTVMTVMHLVKLDGYSFAGETPDQQREAIFKSCEVFDAVLNGLDIRDAEAFPFSAVCRQRWLTAFARCQEHGFVELQAAQSPELPQE